MNYTEKSITYFDSDLSKIRARPAMYIGPVDNAGVFTVLREVCDNAVDEARAGRNKLIDITVSKSGEFTVFDNGVGIPVKLHPKAKISTLTHVLTNLQSSGKMDTSGSSYQNAIGTHGVGIKATNALSSSFEVWTLRTDSGGWHYTKFEKGKEKAKVCKRKPPIKLSKGTVVRFMPDSAIFGKHKLEPAQLFTWAELTAYMNPGLRIRITAPNGKVSEYLSKRGIIELLDKRLTEMKAQALNPKAFLYTSATIELALYFADIEGYRVDWFTNTVANPDGGFHADGFWKALAKALDPYKGRADYKPADLREGLLGILNYKIDAPQFSSQTKEKLVDTRMREPAYKECLQAFTDYFAKNKTLAKQLCQRASELRAKTASFLEDKQLIKKVKSAGNTALITKLAGIDKRSKVPVDDRELALVEGGSAGGTAKLARDKTYQATYELRGKPLNVMETPKARIAQNAEIANLLAALGVDLTGKTTNINYGKIMFLADPDVDGAHINTLLLGLFWRFLPHLFKEGRIYVVAAPEYVAHTKKGPVFGFSLEDVYKKAGTDKIEVRHIKGYGEISPQDMKAIAFDPKTRMLYRVKAPTSKDEAANFEALLGKDATYRKQLLGLV